MPQQKTLDEILAEAKAFLGQRHVVDDAADAAQSGRAVEKARQDQTPLSKLNRYGKPVVDGVKAAAVPAAFLSGPIGMAAGAYLTAEGIKSAVDAPTAMNVSMAGLGMLPFVKPAMKVFGKGARAVGKVVGEVDRFMPNTPGFSGPSKAQVIPKEGSRVPFARETPFNPAEPHMANMPGPRPAYADTAADRVQGSVDRFMPNTPAGAQVMPAAETMPQSAMSLVERYMPNTPSSGGDDLTQTLMQQADEFDNGAVPAHLAELDRLHEASIARRVPNGVVGDEFAGIKPWSKDNALTPEELAAEDEFWESLIRQGR